MKEFELYELPQDKCFSKFTKFAMRDADGNIYEPYENFAKISVGIPIVHQFSQSEYLVVGNIGDTIYIGGKFAISDTYNLMKNYRKKTKKYVYDENFKVIEHPYFGDLVGKIDINLERYKEESLND